MAKFKQFADFLIEGGAVGEAQLVNLRRILRQAGLLQCGGQGYAAKDLTVSDVTNVFLALVATNEVQNAPSVIRFYRSATCNTRFHAENCSPWPFTGVSESDNLGVFLDRFFEGLVNSAKYPDLPWAFLHFAFDIVDGNSGSASLTFSDGDKRYVLKFLVWDSNARIDPRLFDEDYCERFRFSIVRRAHVAQDALEGLVLFVIESLHPGAFSEGDAE
jgi:hypothetical protein